MTRLEQRVLPEVAYGAHKGPRESDGHRHDERESNDADCSGANGLADLGAEPCDATKARLFLERVDPVAIEFHVPAVESRPPIAHGIDLRPFVPRLQVQVTNTRIQTRFWIATPHGGGK